jgi:uncharacterized protein DUF5985
MAELVYLLCAVSSVACAALLFRGHRRSGERLLLWSAIGFTGLALNNIVLVIDLVLTPPSVDLSLVRTSLALAGMLVMVGGFVWEAP